MKFVDIINEEKPFIITSDNGKINVNITCIHPEITFEDNSMLIFDSVDSYYKFIDNKDLYSKENKSINIEDILDHDYVIGDNVSEIEHNGEKIIAIYSILYAENNIYYIQRTGINNISQLQEV